MVVINHTELIVPKFLSLINAIIEKGFDLLCLDKRNEAIFIESALVFRTDVNDLSAKPICKKDSGLPLYIINLYSNNQL